MPTSPIPALSEYLGCAETWLAGHVRRRTPSAELLWGEGSDDVSLFRTLPPAEERALLERARRWQQIKSDAGYGSISWPVEYGGAGLPKAYETSFRHLEQGFEVPAGHEALGISMNIEAPTILALGSAEQKERLVKSLRRADEICCQLFSEPAAGSDLGSVGARAEADGDEWIINGQKVWTSGAQFADLGYLLARTDRDAPRQTGFTAFLVPMESPGVEVRPLRQMTGGASFSEVFLEDVRVPDTSRLGEVGGGWHAAMTTLGFERVASVLGGGGGSATALRLLILLARHVGRETDPVVRQELAKLHSLHAVRNFTYRRARDRVAVGGVPGPEGSLGKLAYTNALSHMTHVASLLLGPRLAADTAEWGTFSWSEFVLGAPGLRIAGGTDEIQRNTIAERILGLPREPR